MDHPLVITEPPLNPPSARLAMAELAFETYGVPALHFVDAGAAAFTLHRAAGRCVQPTRGGLDEGREGKGRRRGRRSSGWAQRTAGGLRLGARRGAPARRPLRSMGDCGVVAIIGHAATTVVPVVAGRPRWAAALRGAAGGALMTDHLAALLRLRHPGLAPGLLGDGVVEAMKERHCAAAEDYGQLLAAVAAAPATAGAAFGGERGGNGPRRVAAGAAFHSWRRWTGGAHGWCGAKGGACSGARRSRAGWLAERA